MNYEAMSDFEVSNAVARILFPKSRVCSADDMLWGDSEKGDVQVIHEVGISGRVVNYCNNPSDAWPIILENRISIKDNLYGQEWRAEKEIDDGEAQYTIADHVCENPLRAAMICYLKLKETTND